ncbi:hypothetical protein SAMN05192553_103325 [Cyclobacterium xiamenense]|uniref:Uncharacterized protein n=1 Tax=Cyclobacterium xiamenense TaxID=1297121 RepID=A0A1H6XXK8_9BACT|nr:hypothetical protein SAMN05192553_103325 [Cyclobacterium xiamenense]
MLYLVDAKTKLPPGILEQVQGIEKKEGGKFFCPLFDL